MYINIRIGISLGFLKLHFNQLNLKKKHGRGQEQRDLMITSIFDWLLMVFFELHFHHPNIFVKKYKDKERIILVIQQLQARILKKFRSKIQSFTKYLKGPRHYLR